MSLLTFVFLYLYSDNLRSIPYLLLFAVGLTITSYCTLAVLHALVRPGPGAGVLVLYGEPHFDASSVSVQSRKISLLSLWLKETQRLCEEYQVPVTLYNITVSHLLPQNKVAPTTGTTQYQRRWVQVEVSE